MIILCIHYKLCLYLLVEEYEAEPAFSYWIKVKDMDYKIWIKLHMCEISINNYEWFQY